MATTTQPPSRRARLREATIAEIKQTARTLLVEHGPEALTLRAIAREMGMTAPALYRYFDGFEELAGALCLDVLDEITVTLRQARAAAPAEDPLAQLAETCRGFRSWALEHPREFQFIFASRAGAPEAPAGHSPDDDLSFGAVFLDIFVQLWDQAPFPVPEESALPESLVAQLREFAVRTQDLTAGRLPLGALAVYLSGWVRLYGAVTIEVFGHLGFALDDPEPMFEAMLADLARTLRPDPS